MGRKVRTTLPTGKNKKKGTGYPFSVRGFTLIEVLLASLVIGTSLIFIAGAMGNLSRHLSQSEIQLEALSLASGEIFAWQNFLRYGGRPSEWSTSGNFEADERLRWQADFSPVVIQIGKGRETRVLKDSLYRLDFQVFRRGRRDPVLRLGAQGLRKEETERFGGFELGSVS